MIKELLDSPKKAMIRSFLRGFLPENKDKEQLIKKYICLERNKDLTQSEVDFETRHKSKKQKDGTILWNTIPQHRANKWI